MEKKNWYKILYAAALLSVIGFAVRAGADYLQYDAAANSAPFRLFAAARALEFLLPAALFWAIGLMMKKRR